MTRQPRRTWVLPVVGLVIVLTAVGGLFARQIYQQQPAPAASPAPVVAPSTSTTTLPPSEEPGPATVQILQDASQYPLINEVTPLLQTYFDSINGRQYDQWRTAVAADRVASTPRSTWLNDFSTTKDGSIQVSRIDLAPQGGLRVLLSFTSTQALSKAPADFPYPCIRWQVIWALGQEHGKWKLDTGPSGKTPQHQKC